jgi:hypothetical protein
MPRKSLTEDGTLGKVAEAKSDGSYLIQVITPGWGSSGYYSPQVLEAAGKAKVWPAGTHMYFDHPTATEDAERPSRSVKDLAAVLLEDASWNGSALVAKVKPAGLGTTVLEDSTFRSAVGVSVRASAEGDVGEAAGRKGWIVKEIFPDTFNSVDLVTHAGRGGMILESARKAEEAGELDSDRRDKFRNAVRDAHASDGVDVWVEDYDDTTVYWDRWGGDDPGTFSQTYTETDDAVELTGDPVQVRVKRTYVPVDEAETPPRTVELTREAAAKAIAESRNVGQWMESRIHLAFTCTADEMFGDGRLTREERISLSAGIGAALDAFTASVEASAPQLYGRDLWADPAALAEAATAVPVHPAGSNPIKEHTMPDIEEARLRELEEAHGRVPTLEAELATQTAAREAAEHRAAVAEASGYAREFGTRRVTDANSELARPIVDRIVAEAMRDITLGEDNRLDTEAFGARIDALRKAEETYLASIAENVGSVRGLGESQTKSTVTEAQASKTVAGVFGVNTPKAG